jgi:hypothetical protein
MSTQDEQAYLQQMEALMGPLARYSDYRVGQTIRYRADGMVKTGEITWITAPGRTSQGTQHPLEYWIGLDVAYQPDIIGLAEPGEEPALITCPHCGQRHQAGTVEQCPQKRKRR